MNIFAISGDETTGEIDWIQSARDLDNLRVVKMILESCQILSTVLNEQGVKAPYRSFNPRHPSCLWAAEASENFENLALHCSAMLEEYTERFGKIHKCERVLATILELYNPLDFPRFSATPLRLAMPPQFKSSNPVKSYRDYYSQKDNMRYPKEKIPLWLRERRKKTMIVL